MEFHERLRWARAQHFDEAKIAAEAMGVPIGTYGNHEAGLRRPRPDQIDLYARKFKVSRAWLALGEGEPKPNNIVAVVGKIAAGGQVDVNAEQLSEAEPLFEIELFDRPVPPNSLALQISGDSMYPRYDDGDVILCPKLGREPATLVGQEAVVISQDHNRYLKLIAEETQPGLFTLESFNARPMRAVPLIWASQVTDVIRAARFRKLNGNSAKRRRKTPA